MRPEYHGAPPPKESKFKLFLPGRNAASGSQARETSARASEIKPLLEATLSDARISGSIASTTMDVLEKQGERIESAAEYTSGVKAISAEAAMHIDELRNKAARKRLVLQLVAVALFATIIALLYHHFFWVGGK